MKILLLEPDYRNKYPPLGLMKLARYHRNRGDEVVFMKGSKDPRLASETWDRAYITTLFSFEWKRTEKLLDAVLKHISPDKIFVGGIAASLMPEEFQAEEKWQGVRFIQGILKDAPAVSLSLREDEEGYEDRGNQPIDELVPAYDILEQIDYEYPAHDAYFGYASRGCIRKCAFCGVPKLEGEQREMPSLHLLVNGIVETEGEKKDMILMDNNITAAGNFHEVMSELRDLGFHAGARLNRDGKSLKRRVDFNQGVDSRVLSKNPDLMKGFATLCLNPLRIAFDWWEVRKHYEIAMHQAADNGLTNLSNYMLYNFMDTPDDLYKRLALNLELNEKLGIRIYSFPMRYQPVNKKDRSHVGKNWNIYYLRSFQVMLQATRGVVSGKADFFRYAYGDSIAKFHHLLLMPHAFIFNRKYFMQGAGRPVLDDWNAKLNKLSDSDELIEWLCSDRRKAKDVSGLSDNVRALTEFYLGYGRTELSKIDPDFAKHTPVIPKDEKIEDAGLYEETE